MLLTDSLAEEQIQSAIRRGEFDDLPGRGQPLRLEDESAVPEELRYATVAITNSTRLILTTNDTFGDIFVYTGAELDLNTLDLTVESPEHPLGGGITNRPGRIIWFKPGTLLFLR